MPHLKSLLHQLRGLHRWGQTSTVSAQQARAGMVSGLEESITLAGLSLDDVREIVLGYQMLMQAIQAPQVDSHMLSEGLRRGNKLHAEGRLDWTHYVK